MISLFLAADFSKSDGDPVYTMIRFTNDCIGQSDFRCDFFDGNMIRAKATNDKKLKLKERRMFSGAVTYSMIQDDHLPFYNLGIRFRLLIVIKKYLIN